MISLRKRGPFVYVKPMRENYTLTRLYLDANLSEGRTLELSSDHAHYLRNVLRLGEGTELRVFNGADGEWRAVISSLGKRAGDIEIKDQLRVPQACPDIWLCFAPVRKHRNAFILEKATELGVAVLQPVTTGRTQFGKLRLDKMQSQIIEAAEQTERLDIPVLNATIGLDQLLVDWPTDRTLIFADEAGDAKPALGALLNLTGPTALLIGPEGGFTPEERDRLRAQDYVIPVSLGPRILRADTAALSLLTLFQATQGDWG